MIKEQFKEWLIDNDYTVNTSVSYANAIGRISENEGIDVYSLNDLLAIDRLVKLYDTDGEFAEIGYGGSGSVRCSMRAFYEFKKESHNKNDDDNISYELTDDEMAEQIVHGYSYKGNLRKSILEDMPKLFPNYQLLSRNDRKYEYSNDDISIDILLVNNNGDLLAVKLEPGAAGVNAFGELATYIGFLTEKYPDKNIKGYIIAGEIEPELKLASKISNMISLKTYKMNLELEGVL